VPDVDAAANHATSAPPATPINTVREIFIALFFDRSTAV